MNDPQQGEPQGESGSVGTRWPEVGVAVFLLIVAALVITDSQRVGTGWGDDGPRSGYFPFYIGVVLAASSGWVLVKQLMRWRQEDEPFAEIGQLRSVASIAVPIVVYLVLIAFLGIYLASFALIAYFMIRHGKHPAWLSALVALGVPLLFFLVFEKWFLVPLPKGPIENLLGL